MNTEMNNETIINTVVSPLEVGINKELYINQILSCFDKDRSPEERVEILKKMIIEEAKEGTKILGKKNAKIERDRARLDDTEERQRNLLARKQKERREAFEAKNQASLKETEQICLGQIAILEEIIEQYSDTGPMLK